MLYIDYIAIGVIILSLLIGLVLGLTKKGSLIFNKWTFSIIWTLIAITFSNIFYLFDAGKEYHRLMVMHLTNTHNVFCNFLINIQIDRIILIIGTELIGIVLMVIMSAKCVDIFDTDNGAKKFFLTLGCILMSALFFSSLFIASLGITNAIDGGINGGIYSSMRRSLLRIDDLYVLSSFVIY